MLRMKPLVLGSVIGALLVGASLPAGVFAGRIIRSTDVESSFQCDPFVTGHGDSVFVAANVGSGFSGADIEVTTVGGQVLTPDFGQPPTNVSFDGTTLDLTIAMLDFTDPNNPVTAAAAHLHAILASNGASQSFSYKSRFGNLGQRVSGVDQPLLVAGTVTDDDVNSGTPIDFSGCTGDTVTSTSVSTNPDTFRLAFDRLGGDCLIANDRGLLEVSGGGGILGAPNVNFAYQPANSDLVYFGSSNSATKVGRRGLSGPLDTFDADGNLLTGAAISVSFSTTSRTIYHLVDQVAKRDVTEWSLRASGAVTMFDGARFDVVGCPFFWETARDSDTTPAGPKPGGTPPANDLPQNASALPSGTTRISTAGAAAAGEADCVDPLAGFGLPIGRTVWYSIAGTGHNVTIDTAGTNFDTAIAVYDGDVGTPLTCIDDVQLGLNSDARTLQGAVTFGAESGHTYLVQIGGVDNGRGFEFGKLVIARR